MPPTDDYADLLRSIQEEWNKAELEVKAAEQVCDNIVIPSVKELRYAGRRLIEALNHINSGAPRTDVEKLLNDALFNCHKSRHDAIDAATAKIAKDIDIAVTKLGHDVVLSSFAEFPALYGDLLVVREKILISRQNREHRNNVYATISAVDFPKLAKTYGQFQACEPLMQKRAASQRRSVIWTWAGWAVALIVTVLAWFFPAWPSAVFPH